MFKKAVRKQARLRLALSGPSGAGKTMGALRIADGIGGRIAVIDTERGSASLYAEPMKLASGEVFMPPEFDALDLNPPYTPERFVEAIHAAEASGYSVLIIDSLTHEWSGVGGCLELVDEIARAKYKGNSWSAWNDVTPRHRALLDAILRSPLHIIATMRSKTETAQTEGPNGRKQVVKLGMKAEQRDGSEYEFTTVLDLIHDGHFATASKDRTGLFSGDPKPITKATGEALRIWLENGAPVDAQPTGMDAGVVADHLAAIDAAESMESLRNAFGVAFTAAKIESDKVSAAAFKAAYDKKVSDLTSLLGA